MSPRPPSGAPAPHSVEIGGRTVDLVTLAEQVCDRYYEEFADEPERYGDAGVKWCRHDNQWLLSWAAGDVLGATDLNEQVRWLARVLHARDFPVTRLARNLQIAATLAAEGAFGDASMEVATRLGAAAETVARLDLDDRQSEGAERST